MQPTSQTTPPVPAQIDSAQVSKANKLKTIWGIICLVGPTALIIISLIAYAILNFALGTTWGYSHGYSGNIATSPSMVQTIGNIALFIVAAIATLTWLPGIVIGIILLATRKRV